MHDKFFYDKIYIQGQYMSVDPKTIFEAVTKPVLELLSDRGLGLYIPSYQRPYSWDKTKVERLIEDINHGMKNLVDADDSFTFLGTVITIHDINHITVQPIVRQDVPNKVLTVIDGQQRMTTLLILCIALHNEISVTYRRFIKIKDKALSKSKDEKENESFDFEENKSESESLEVIFNWLDGQIKELLAVLSGTFYEEQAYGETPFYPRMIRSLDDTWSKKTKDRRYHSSIAHLIFSYIEQIKQEDYQATEFKPSIRTDKNIEGEEALVKRFDQLKKFLRTLPSKTDAESEEVPSIEQIYGSDVLQEGLLGYKLDEVIPKKDIESIKYIDENLKQRFDELMLLFFYAKYILNRVVVTVVKGKNEDYAFTIFESLNTTGEPLTAFETFKPRVINAVGLAEYEGSLEKELMDEVADYLSSYPAGNKLQKATKELLINFLGAYSGTKVSGRLAEQRIELKKGFEGASNGKERLFFIQSLADCTNFKRHFWESQGFNNTHKYIKDFPLSSTSKLCLTFLNELNHSIVIPVLSVFFSQIVACKDNYQRTQRIKDFESALKAVVAFSVLWRAAFGGTSGIDSQYRELLNNRVDTELPALSRINMKNNTIDIALFKQELKSRLVDVDRKGRIDSKETFIARAADLPIYAKQYKVAKLLLLAAHHDAIEDSNNPGLLVKGRDSISPYLTVDKYKDKGSFTIEHIAPQKPDGKWDHNIYNNGTSVDTLGNLVLISSKLNSALGNRLWPEKQVLYRAVGAKTTEETNKILSEAARNHGISFRENTKDILDAQSYMPNLVTLGNIDAVWDAEWIKERSEHLYGLAWNELISWLK